MRARKRIVAFPVAGRHREGDGAFARMVVGELFEKPSAETGNAVGSIDEELEPLKGIAVFDEEPEPVLDVVFVTGERGLRGMEGRLLKQQTIMQAASATRQQDTLFF